MLSNLISDGISDGYGNGCGGGSGGGGGGGGIEIPGVLVRCRSDIMAKGAEGGN